MDLNDREDIQFAHNSSHKEFKKFNPNYPAQNDEQSYHQAGQDSGFYQGQEFIQEQPQVNSQEYVEEDFVLMDVIGGGCSAQIGTNGTLTNAAKSVAVHHPTKPIVAYSAGCMIIVYDLMNDSKVNLMGHRHNIYALAFTPNGNSLLSVDFNRDAEIYNSQIAVEDGEQYGEPSSNLFMWDWQRGLCNHSTPIPRASSIAQALISNQNEQSYRSHLAQPSESTKEYGNQEAKANHACYVQISFDKSGSLFLILESTPIDIGGGYRVTIWSFNKQSQMEMISSLDLELQSPAIDIGFLPRSQSEILQAQRSAGQNNHSTQVFLHTKFQFYTAERNCIKIWEYWQGNPILKKRIHIKQLICQVIISEITNFFIILGEIGKLLILDAQGEFVSTLAQEGIVFSKVGQANDKIFLGTTRGTVQIYHLASLGFISEIPYQLSFMEKFSLNSTNRNRQQLDVLSLQKVGPPVVETGITQNLRYLWIRYSDGSFAMIDRTIQNPRQAILGFSAGHFENISGMQWIKSRSALDTFSHIGSFVNKQTNSFSNDFGNDKTIPVSYQEQEDLQFMTVSHDLSIHVWRHYGDRWAFSYIDIAKSFDQSLSFQRKQCDRSTRDMKLTAICLYPRSNNLVVGDNRGYVRVYQLVNENAHIIATHRLARSAELELEEKLGINTLNDQRTPILFANSQQQYESIKEIYITKNEQVAVVTFESGCISIYDTKNGYSLIGEINDQEFSKFNTQYNDLKSMSIQARIIESTNHLSANQYNIYNKQSYGQDEMPGFQIPPTAHSALYDEGLNQSTLSAKRQGLNLPTISSNRFLGNHIGNSLKVLSLGAPNQVSLQLVDIKGGSGNLTRSKLSQFVISEGKVNGFDVHPSGDYILITSSKGRIFVFRVDTGELRGTIKVPMNCTGCLIDPSGLYVCIKVPAYTHQNTYNLIYDQKEQQERLGLFTSSQRDFERNTVLVYEIGRGLPAAEIAQVFDISTMAFSPDGKYLSLGSTNGAVSVWSMSNSLYQNVKQVLEGIKLQPDFWFNYPIFLPDFEQYNNEQNYLNQRGQNLITIQENTRENTTRSHQQQMSPLPPQRLKQESQQPTNQTRYEQFNPQIQQFNQYQQQKIPQQVSYQIPIQQNQVQNFQNLNNPNFQEQFQQRLNNQNFNQFNISSQQTNLQQPIYKPRSQSSQRMIQQQKPLTHVSNEQRFLRNSFVNKNQLNQAEVPIQNWQQEQQRLREQQQNLDYLEFLKKQQQPQQLWQQTTSFGINQSLSNGQFDSIDPNKLAAAQFQNASFIPPSYKPVNQQTQKKSFTQNEAVATLLGNNYEQPNSQENQQKYAPNHSAPNGFFNPQIYNPSVPQINNNYLQNYNPPGFQQQQANNYSQQYQPYAQNLQQTPNPYLQGLQPTLSYKDPRVRSQSSNFWNKDDPIPVNHSELLYNRPLNQSKYADVVSHDIGNMQTRYQMTFDRSLNDRELTGAGLPNHMLQKKNSFTDLNRKTQVDYFQPKKLEQQQFQEQILKTSQDQIQNQENLKKRVDHQNQDDLFKPKGFTNLKTQQDILRSSFQGSNLMNFSPLKAGLRPDPEDIDGDQKNQKVKDQELGSETEHMLQELDGLNKYLKGVKVPNQLRQSGAKVQPITLQQFKNQDSAKNKRNIIEQSSNYSLTDEVYQNIEDFEKKLNLV